MSLLDSVKNHARQPGRTAGAIVPRLVAIVICWGGFYAHRLTDAAEVTFQHDVMAVLSKAGCNAGACHGNQNGRGGFFLSLRGQDPQHDYDSLVHALSARRIDRIRPEQSLILLKPTMAVAHQGGLRFPPHSREYEILYEWIRGGAAAIDHAAPDLLRIDVTPRQLVLFAPDHEVQLDVTAVFSDGQRRDVTSLAVYEPNNLLSTVTRDGLVTCEGMGETTVLVRYLTQQVPCRIAFVPARPDFQWSPIATHNYIDRLVDQRLRQLRINPSRLAEDHVFVRRAYLDVLGILPTADEARSFVASTKPDKHERLIDALLARPEFAEHWALKWSDLLRNEEKVLDPTGVDLFHAWIRDSFASGVPLDQFVRQLVTSRGSTYKNPPANFYRANRDSLSRAEATARLFLGIRLQCAKCHNHPFDRWTQDDYYGWAANFARIDYEIVENKRRDKYDKNEFQGEQVVLVKDEGEVVNPHTGQCSPPQFLAESTCDHGSLVDPLEQLGNWLTSPANTEFARAQVNRIVYHLLGRGLVDPVDDFRATNPPNHPELLDALAEDFVRSGFDLRHMVRLIMNSRTYQLSAVPNETNEEDQREFSRAMVRRLTAEQLLDAQCQVLGVAAQFNGFPRGIRAGQLPGVRRVRLREQPPAAGDRFLTVFGKPPRLMSCECERTEETTLSQAFMLISGEGLQGRLTSPDSRLAKLTTAGSSPSTILDELYWSALSRPPTAVEAEEFSRLLAESPDRLASLQDIAWAVLNSKEFIFRH